MAILNGLTHAIIFFNSVSGASQTGVSAMVKLCFGSDDDAISQVLYRAEGKTPLAWRLPVRNGPEASSPGFDIFTGKMGEEILAAVGRTAARIKTSGVVGKLAGRAFRVTKVSIEEIQPEAKQESPVK